MLLEEQRSLLGGIEGTLADLGCELLEWRKAGKVAGAWHGSQFKAEADRHAHEFLIRRLRELAPEIPVISEEDVGSHVTSRPDRYWIIDPIDGTASFAGGFPGFVTQVALVESGQPVLSVVRAPVIGVTYSARLGQGARRNGSPMSVSHDTSRCILVDNYPKPQGTAEHIFGALRCTGYREFGSIGLKICLVAEGFADLAFKDVVVRDWDIAPATLILAEAGGCLSDPRGKAFRFVGSLKKPGFVAARDQSLAMTAVRALQDRRTAR